MLWATRPQRSFISMATGKKPASDAGKILQGKSGTKKEKEVAGSDLAQHKPAAKPSNKK